MNYNLHKHQFIFGSKHEIIEEFHKILNKIEKYFEAKVAVLVSYIDSTLATRNLQINLNNITEWLQKWKMKVNKCESMHVTLTLRKGPPIRIYNFQLLPRQIFGNVFRKEAYLRDCHFNMSCFVMDKFLCSKR